MKFRNRYFAMRHGESDKNVQGVIDGDPAHLDRFSLTESGRKQVAESVRESELSKLGPVRVYSSDFRRARETAEIAAQRLETTGEVEYAPALRERYWGQYEGKSNALTVEIWEHDRTSIDTAPKGVEPIAEVAERTSGFLRELERKHNGETILLVSHGDPLQALTAWAERADLHRHFEHRYQPGEIKELAPTGDAE